MHLPPLTDRNRQYRRLPPDVPEPAGCRLCSRVFRSARSFDRHLRACRASHALSTDYLED